MSEEMELVEVTPERFESLWWAVRGMIEGAMVGEKLGIVGEEAGVELMALAACVWRAQTGWWPTKRQLQSAIVGPEGMGRNN